ncbi:MAG: VCBS repeat-containing protein [Bacteroidota bacterium]
MKFNNLVVLLAGVLFWSCSGDSNKDSSTAIVDKPIEWTKIKRSPTKFEILDPAKTGISANNSVIENAGLNYFTYPSLYMGSGVGVADFNNDGLPDIYMGQSLKSDVLYMNKGNMQFEDVSNSSLPEDNYWTAGVSVVDINNDGLMDIYVCKFGPTMEEDKRKNQLLVNRGNGRFRDEAKKYGLDDAGFTTQTAFFDVDNDGDKDAYVVNQPPDKKFLSYLGYPEPTQAEMDRLYSDHLYIRNEQGKYEDKSIEYGIRNYSFGLNVLVNDINDDGWLDLYVCNDYEKPDYIYINQQGKGFVNELEQRTGHISNFSMGSDVADINNDGFNDIGVLDMSANDHYRSKTNMGAMNEEAFWENVNEGNYFQYMFNTLQLNQGNGFYSEIAQMSGIAQTDWSWSIVFEDFNLDGLKDCYITNGIKKDVRNNDALQLFKDRIDSGIKEINPMVLLDEMPSNPISNFYYESSGPLTYQDKSKESGAYSPDFSTGCAIGDFDGDGDFDIVVNVGEGPAKLIQNKTEHTSTVYSYKLDKSLWNDFLYSKFVLETNFGIQRKDIVPARGYQSSSWDKVIFGIPEGGEVYKAYVTTLYGDTYELPLVAGELSTLSQENLKKTKAKSGMTPTLFSEHSSLEYSHEENAYNDFKKEILLPHKLSEEGPCTALMDVTGNGEKDLFVGGSLGLPLTQFRKKEGKWEAVNQSSWSAYTENENRNFVFFDADGDGDQDLYIVNGGNEDVKSGSSWLEDQLFINDGSGNFSLSDQLPKISKNTSVAISMDIDSDQDLDVVVFGAHMIGQYPKHIESYTLENDGGKFSVSNDLSIGLDEIGIVSDAVKLDYNGDGVEDIVVVGSWSTPHVLLGNGEKLRLDAPMELSTLSSWWESIETGDYNGDGRLDIVLGSFGENNKFHPSEKKPLEIFGNDFDGSGSNDVVLAKHYKDKVVPTRGRECSSQQIPDIEKKFPTYNQFALAGIEDILGEDNIEAGVHKKINGMSHKILWNKPSGWEVAKLPEECQIAPLKAIESIDINKDGIQDMVGIGNHFGAEVETARYDAGFGWVVLGSKDGNLVYLPAYKSGLMLSGDGRSLETVETKNGTELLAFFNNAPAKSYLLP